MFNENKKTAKRVCMKNKVKKDVNLYRIEQLEPRLMMDGNQWGNEIQSSVYYAVGSALLGVAA